MNTEIPEPYFTLACLLAGLTLLVLAGLFKNLALQWRSSAGTPLLYGAAAGLAIAVSLGRTPLPAAVITGIAMTLSAAYLYRRGLHSEPLEGFMRGALGGIAATAASIAAAPRTDSAAAGLILAGGTAGVVLTFLRERWKSRTLLVLGIAATVATLASAAVRGAGGYVDGRHMTLATALIPSAVVFLGVFLRWPRLLRELEEEARLGLMQEDAVRPTANPIRRLFRGGWPDRALRRRFVMVANELAIRKRQQRTGHPDLARIHQLDVFKLRSELQDLSRMRLMLDQAAERKADGSDMSRVDF